MYPHNNVGGWLCAVKMRERKRRDYARDGEKKRAQQRARYDADPVHRIGHNLRKAARNRSQTIARLTEGS